jgi:hypothetical protein
MQFADWLSVIGFFVAGAGSMLAMLGVFKQAKPFTSISMWEFPDHIRRVFFKYLLKGKDEAYLYVRTAALTGNAAAQEAPEPAPEVSAPAAKVAPAALPVPPAGAAPQNNAARATEEQKEAETAAAQAEAKKKEEARQKEEALHASKTIEIIDNLFALYLIFSGFILQFIGAVLLLFGTLLAPHPGAGAPPGGG